ncbi:DNA-directed RNA polymerase subunit beta [Sphaerochaeta sp. UBA5849]|uniref:DNA-directed RNA polymerase subunit beta n=1 Tax=Sphaerochaeta sp. UBA5849 TaxID=1947475 RepID=UPI0031F52F11
MTVFAPSKKHIQRRVFGRAKDLIDLPDLVEVQRNSYRWFFQAETEADSREAQGLQEILAEIFPIESYDGSFALEFVRYFVDESPIMEEEARQRDLTWSMPVRATIRLVNRKNGEIKEEEIYLGDFPVMTDRGTFIVNGTERVVVNQLARSAGVYFSADTTVPGGESYAAKVIPDRGAWLEFDLTPGDVLSVNIDNRKKIPVTMLLKAFGATSDEEILKLFGAAPEQIDLVELHEEARGRLLAEAVLDKEGQVLIRRNDRLTKEHLEQLFEMGMTKVWVWSVDNAIAATLERDTSRSGEDAVLELFRRLRPNEPARMENAREYVYGLFFDTRRYNLGRVGRYKLNKRLGLEIQENQRLLTIDDVVAIIQGILRLRNAEETEDDIDHLGNRRVRAVGELLQNQVRIGLLRMERIAKERMTTLPDLTNATAKDLINVRPISASLREFFGSAQLSQFMDQVNPLAELTHKRRLNALGPGGLSRDRAGFEVRDVHYTHYGRICPIETPEGPNIGLIVSLANYTRINQHGFLETPYRKVVNGVVTKQYRYLDANDEEKFFIAQASAKLDSDGNFHDNEVPVRRSGDYSTKPPAEIKYMDVDPKQVISVAASLIPFLEHDDANRALMGSNMQRQAVPLVFPETPRVGTGMEGKTAYDSGVLVKAKRSGTVTYVSSDRVVVQPDSAEIQGQLDTYEVQKYQRTNQDTCFNQKPIVSFGQHVEAGEVLADGPATQSGELALGRNILVGFVPWNGYNYEDAVLISERVVKDDIFTSVHIKEFTTDIRETKLGPEKLTRDIPNTSEKMLEQLDEDGIVRIGTAVRPGSILVGKVTPKSESDTTPEFKLLNSIFGEKAKEVRDTSLKVPHGTEGTVIDIQRLKRSNNDELPPGVEETVKVLIATKRKLRQGDKMAGRHGNKGVVSRILAEEDMPYMADGTPLDVCLNPLGVPSRMNIGQLMETQLGWAAVKLDKWYSTPVFQSATMAQIEEKMREAGLPENSKTVLYNGLTGVPFVNPVFCGYIYYLKLHHLVDDKMHARSTGPYSLVTQQPLGGKAQFGGQRLGEMEVWALEAYGAANTLQELLTIKSDDMNGRVKIYESIVKGEPATTAGMPEAFNVLVQEIRGLALDMSVYDSKGRQVPLTERDEELIAKQSKGSLN